MLCSVDTLPPTLEFFSFFSRPRNTFKVCLSEVAQATLPLHCSTAPSAAQVGTTVAISFLVTNLYGQSALAERVVMIVEPCDPGFNLCRGTCVEVGEFAWPSVRHQHP